MTPEQKKENGRKYREAHRGEQRAYRQAHKDEFLKWRRTWRASHKDQIRDYQHDYRRRYNQSARGKVKGLVNDAKRRALKRSCTHHGDRNAIAAVYSLTTDAARIICYLCGRPVLVGDRAVDHVKALSRGGPHSAENLAIVHAWCNGSKHDRDISEVGLLPFPSTMSS